MNKLPAWDQSDGVECPVCHGDATLCECKREWCFNNIDECDVTLSLRNDGRVTLLYNSQTIEIPWPVVEALATALETFPADKVRELLRVAQPVSTVEDFRRKTMSGWALDVLNAADAVRTAERKGAHK